MTSNSTPPPTPPTISWDAMPPRHVVDQWAYQRRAELLTTATQLSFAMIRMADLQTSGGYEPEPSEEQQARADRALAERAVAVAAALQRACDRTRPRPS